MRIMEINLGGKDVELSLSFGAASEIAQKVADPLLISRESELEYRYTKAGIVGYDPKFKFTLQTVCAILHIGAKHVNKDVTLEAVQEMVFDDGMMNAQGKATDYLVEMLGARPEEADSVAKGEKPGK